MNPKNKFAGAFVAIVVILGFGTLGYKLLTEWTWFDSFYFTLITITTIGYTEPAGLTENGRYFGTLLIVVGVGTLGYALSVAVQSVVSLEIVSSLGKRRLMNEIQELNDHYIVCGAGRVGRRIGQEITARGLDCVLIETEDRAEPFESDGFRVLKGDATKEEVLKSAGIERARGIVCAVSSDPENLYITLTARDLNQGIHIVARAKRGVRHPQADPRRCGQGGVAGHHGFPADGADAAQAGRGRLHGTGVHGGQARPGTRPDRDRAGIGTRGVIRWG